MTAPARVRRFWQARLQAALCAALTAGATGCDNDKSKEAAPASRVQAVLAAPGVRAAPSAGSKVAAELGPAGAAKEISRPALCAGQLNSAGGAFKPTQQPSRKQRGAGEPLPEDPLASDGRWTWLNLWAAWCVPCKRELPLLLAWQRSLKNQLNVSFVSLDDDERQLDKFLNDQPDDGLKRTYWLTEGEQRVAWLQALQLQDEPELPLQLLIDPKGQVRCQVSGAVEPSDLDALVQLLGAD